jgi:redox-sensitive bicupin YhaK (pirin superfamily)
MIELRPFNSLGHAQHGWLNARHHFCFADYYDPQRSNWGQLLVWNDDEIAANTGFPAHPHRDMEIITYVRQGAISHQDSLGNQGRTQAGDVQVMSAGTGIRHSEYNLEPTTSTLFQIWIRPNQLGQPPSWGSKPFPKSARAGQLEVLASGYDCDSEALRIKADARMLAATLLAGQSLKYALTPAQKAYLVPASGLLEVNGVRVNARDGLAISHEDELCISALEDSELVLVELN